MKRRTARQLVAQLADLKYFGAVQRTESVGGQQDDSSKPG